MSTKDNWKGRIQKFRELGHEITPAIEKIIEAEKELSREEGRKEERQFILNVLDGIDQADREMGNKFGGTKAIRFALQSRIIN